MFKFFARFQDPDGWLDALPAEGRTLDRGYRRALRRRVHFPDGRPEFAWRDLLPWRRPKPEPIQRVEKRLPPPSDPVVDHYYDALARDARQEAQAEVARHIDGLPRGRERARKFEPLVRAHETRTTRVVVTEMRRERRAAGQRVPDIDYRRRLVGEMKALEAEISAERRAETFDPLSEQELAVRQGQLALVRLLLDMDSSRADLTRRRRVQAFVSGSGSDDDGGNHDAPQRRPSIDLGMEL